MYKIVLLRHGESTWNQENRFCGWFDADLSQKGMDEARHGAKVSFFFFIFHFRVNLGSVQFDSGRFKQRRLLKKNKKPCEFGAKC